MVNGYTTDITMDIIQSTLPTTLNNSSNLINLGIRKY